MKVNTKGEETMLKKGDYIYCHDAEDMKQTLHDLGEDMNAVVWDQVRFIIKVNAVKGEKRKYE